MKWKLGLTLLGAGLLAWSGCVSIDQNVPVYAPGQVEQLGRSPLDVCEPHTLPHKLIQATTSMSSSLLTSGNVRVSDQATFDIWWSQVNATLDPKIPVASNGEPLVDWNTQVAWFTVLPLINTCQHISPYGQEVTTDCYTISFWLYSETDGPPCDPQSLVQQPVYIYIYPNINLPGGFKYVTPTPQDSPTATATATDTPTPTPTPTVTPTPSPAHRHKKRHVQIPV